MRRRILSMSLSGLVVLISGAAIWHSPANPGVAEWQTSTMDAFVVTDAEGDLRGFFGPGLFLWLFFFTAVRRERDEVKDLPEQVLSVGK